MPTGIFHRNKTPATRPGRPMSAPAISTISDNRLSYAQADRQGGRDNVGPTPKELMSFSSLLKGSAQRPYRKGKIKAGEGIVWGPITYSPALYALFTSWQIINITAIYAIVICCRCKALYSRPCKNFPWDRSRWFVIIP